MGLFDFLKKQNQNQKCTTETQLCIRCKKRIRGAPAPYTFAFHVADSVSPPLCKKCAESMSFSVKYILICDNDVFKFALLTDEMLEIRVWIEKNTRDFIIKKETRYLTDDSIAKQQRISREPRNITELLWEIQHLCKEFKLDFEKLKNDKELLKYVFSSDDPNVFVPKLMRTEFNQYDLKALTRVREIKIGKNICSCSIIEQPLTVKINNTSFAYSRIEGVHLSQGYNFIERIKINNDEFFLYYVEHPSKNDILGWSIYSLSAHMYDHLKFGGKIDDIKCSLLGEAYISNPTQCIPYVVAAVSNKMKIVTKNGETCCE